MLVDDHPGTVRQLIEASAGRFSEAIFTVAISGEDALMRLSEGLVPQAILLDLTLPMLSGFQVLERIRSDPVLQDVPVIIFTVDDSDAARHACKRLGASYYQVKPSSRTGYSAFATFLSAGLEHGAFFASPGADSRPA